jgi:hypothetical protein
MTRSALLPARLPKEGLSAALRTAQPGAQGCPGAAARLLDKGGNGVDGAGAGEGLPERFSNTVCRTISLTCPSRDLLLNPCRARGGAWLSLVERASLWACAARLRSIGEPLLFWLACRRVQEEAGLDDQ